MQRFDGTSDVEVGYDLGRAAWSRGVATEAGGVALRRGFDALGLPRVVAVVRPENEGSKRVLSKLGLSCRGVEDQYGVRDVELWDIGRDAWIARRPQIGAPLT